MLNSSDAMTRGQHEVGKENKKRNQAPYLGAFQSLKAISCKNLSAGIVRFPPCCMTTTKEKLKS